MTQRKLLKRKSEMKLTPPPEKGKPRGKPFEKGNPGRPKGAKDKFTTLKQAFLDAFRDEEIGGSKGMVKVFKKSDAKKIMFFKIMAGMLPRNVDVTLPTDTVIKVITAVPGSGAKKPKSKEKK